MGIAELAKADFEFIAGPDGEYGEAIEYQAITEAGPQAWKAIRAVVDRGDPSNPMDMGSLGRRGPMPILVSISKDATTGIARVREKDFVKLDPGTDDEKIYRVNAILNPGDPAVWRFHAVP